MPMRSPVLERHPETLHAPIAVQCAENRVNTHIRAECGTCGSRIHLERHIAREPTRKWCSYSTSWGANHIRALWGLRTVMLADSSKRFNTEHERI